MKEEIPKSSQDLRFKVHRKRSKTLFSYSSNHKYVMTRKELQAIAVATIIFSYCFIIPSMHHVKCKEEVKEVCFLYKSKTVFMNHGNKSWTLSEYDRSYSIFSNNSWQSAYLTDCNWPFKRSVDIDGNSIIILDVPPIPPGGNTTIVIKIKIVESEREAPDINFTMSGKLDDIPPELKQEFCEPQGTWQVDNDTLRNLSYQIWQSIANTTNVLKIVCALADWIGNNITYMSHDIAFYPTETFNSREGDCDDQANLLITMCRILGIPSFLQVGCLQYLTFPENESYWNGHLITYLKLIGFHAWAMAYIPPWGWLPFDMTWGRIPSDMLSGIKSAAVYSLYTAQMMNITKSDWAGEGRVAREIIVNSPIYIYDEEELKPCPAFLPQEELWESVKLYIAMSFMVIIISITVFKLLHRRRLESFSSSPE